MHKPLLCTFMMLSSLLCMAQDGYPDPAFGVQGLSLLQPGTSHDVAQDVYALGNGKTLVAGLSDAGNFNFDAVITRLNADGSVDTSFGVDGWYKPDMGAGSDYFYEMSVDETTGKITLCGAYSVSASDTDPMIVRLNEDGSPDLTFSDDGIFTTVVSPGEEYLYSLEADGTGNIYACGSATMPNFTVRGMILQIDDSGNLVTTFGTNGIAYSATGEDYTYYFSLCLPANSTIVAAGYVNQNFSQYMLVSNFTLEGDPLALFADNGNLISTEPSIAFDVVYYDTHYLVCGTQTTFDGNNGFVSCIGAEGESIETFGTNGTLTIALNPVDVLMDLAIENNTRIVAVGTTGEGAPTASDYLAIRFNGNGQLDPAFHQDGISIQNIGELWEEAQAVATEGPNIIYLAGFKAGDNNDIAVMRLGPFMPQGIDAVEQSTMHVYPVPAESHIQIQVHEALIGTNLNVLDATGRIVYQTRIRSGLLEMDISELSSGIYTITAGEEQSRFVKK